MKSLQVLTINRMIYKFRYMSYTFWTLFSLLFLRLLKHLRFYKIPFIIKTSSMNNCFYLLKMTLYVFLKTLRRIIQLSQMQVLEYPSYACAWCSDCYSPTSPNPWTELNSEYVCFYSQGLQAQKDYLTSEWFKSFNFLTIFDNKGRN